MVKYNGDILKRLKDAGYSSYKLETDKLIGNSIVTKIRSGNTDISVKTLNTLCRLLSCQPSDVLVYVPDGVTDDVIDTD